MWSTNLTPQVFEHGKPGKCNKRIYVVELFFSSHLIERHLFTNKRTYDRYACHLCDLFPSDVSRYYSGISFDYYMLFYDDELYNNLLNID